MLGNLRSKLQKGRLVVGTFVKMPGLCSAEILGELQYDFLVLDMEHSPFGFEQLETVVAASDAVRIATIIRVPDKQEHLIVKALDLGCDGVQVPMIEDREDALASMDAARYQPLGHRSISFATRAARYSCIDRQQHIENSNRDVVLAVQIESWSAVEKAEAIASVEGVDVLFVGPADLSQSLGIPGQSSDPRVLDGIRIVGLAAKKYGKALGTHVNKLEDVERVVDYGVTYLVYSTDIGLFVRGAKEGLSELRRAVGI